MACLLDLGDDLSRQARFHSMWLDQAQRGIHAQVTLAHTWLTKEEAQLSSCRLRCI